MKKTLLLLLVSIICIACTNDDDSTPVPYTLIAESNLNGGAGIPKQNLVITNGTIWNNLITSMDSENNVSDSFTETTIDFSTYTVIAVFDEVRPSSAYGLEVGVFQDVSNIIVDVNYISFGGDAFTMVRQPFYIVKIENSNLPIVFQ
jgi:hypothetical protein